MKKLIALIMAALMLCACGAPTAQKEETPLEITQKLFAAKAPYIGDASAVGKIIRLLGDIDSLTAKGIELKTDAQPYGLTRNFTGMAADDEALCYQAAILMCLVDNMDFVTYNTDGGTVTFTRDELGEMVGAPLSDYAVNVEKFAELRKMDFGSDSGDDFIALVGKTIIEQNKSGYAQGECAAEGHVIYDVCRSDERVEVYAAVMYGEYGFQNNNFVKISGSGVIPTKITYTPQYKVLDYEMPDDGALYTESLKKLFPETLWDRVMTTSKEDMQLCTAQEQAYAQDYLETIGRVAKVGGYSDFEYPLPDMATAASNALLENKDLSNYPYWIGNEEKIEDGVRVVYETAWQSKGGGDGTVTYKKYNYDDKKVLEEKSFTIAGGALK